MKRLCHQNKRQTGANRLIFLGLALFFLQTPFGGLAKQQAPKKTPATPPKPARTGVVFDDYPFNFPYYNTCYPQLDMAFSVLLENPTAICLIEGYRDRREKRWVSKKRTEIAKRYLVEFKNIPPERVLIQDRGFEKRPEGLPGIPRGTHIEKMSQNGGIVISVYLPLEMTSNQLSRYPLVFDGYLKTSARYDSCASHLDLAKGELFNDPNLICIIEGHRDPGESRFLSAKRSQKAADFLGYFSEAPNRIKSLDAGTDQKIWLDPTGNVPRPFLGHTNRFIAIGLFHPVAITGFQ